MEASRASLELCSFDPQEVESLEVIDVEAAAAVHQHLGESGVDDDGVDYEWVDIRADDAVEVIITVEGDGGAGAVNILGHRHSDRKDLPTLPLALSRRELCRGPAIDHVVVMNHWEFIVVLAATFVITLVFLLVILLYAQAVKIFL